MQHDNTAAKRAADAVRWAQFVEAIEKAISDNFPDDTEFILGVSNPDGGLPLVATNVAHKGVAVMALDDIAHAIRHLDIADPTDEQRRDLIKTMVSRKTGMPVNEILFEDEALLDSDGDPVLDKDGKPVRKTPVATEDSAVPMDPDKFAEFLSTLGEAPEAEYPDGHPSNNKEN